MIIETVFALLLIMDHKIIEHRIQPSMGMCLRGKREAERQYSETVSYKCYKGKAQTELYLGEKHITALILE